MQEEKEGWEQESILFYVGIKREEKAWKSLIYQVLMKV